MKNLMKIFGLGILLLLDAKLMEKLGVYREEPTMDDFFIDDEDDDILDDEYAPGYGDAVTAISTSDMFSSHKKEAISHLPIGCISSFYKGIISAAHCDMFSAHKRDLIIEMSKRIEDSRNFQRL